MGSVIDTHCHLYLSEFENDLDDVLDTACMNGVYKFLLPAIDSQTHDALLRTCNFSNKRFQLHPMMGLHPCSVKEDFEKELEIAWNYLNNGSAYCAIGEIGLDFHWDVTYKEQQFIAFRKQIEWAVDKDLPIVIHSRKSTYECIEILKEYKGKVQGVFHCFGGSVEEAEEIVKLGLYMGIGGVVTYKNAQVKEVVRKLDLSHFVLETDAPYLAPQQVRGKRNSPTFLRFVAYEMADLTGKTREEIEAITTSNAKKLFKL